MNFRKFLAKMTALGQKAGISDRQIARDVLDTIVRSASAGPKRGQGRAHSTADCAPLPARAARQRREARRRQKASRSAQRRLGVYGRAQR